MPKVNFDNVRDIEDGDPLPEGWYLTCVAKVSASTTKSGDEMWIVDFQVIEGPHKGRRIFDTLNFSPAALPRIKFFFGVLGLDVSGTRRVTLDDIKDAIVSVKVAIEETTDNGRLRKRNIVPFSGFAKAKARSDRSSATKGASSLGRDDEDCPF